MVRAAMTEHAEKRARVRALLAGDADVIALRDPANLAWYLGGARVHVVGGVSAAICEVAVGAAHEELRTSVIESPRMAAEELGPGAPRLRALPWWEPLGPDAGASDRPRPGERDMAGALIAARSRLLPPEVDRYRALARETAAAAGAALRAASAAESEFALAGRAARELLDRGIDPVVLLVAGEARLPRHRHPLPTAAPPAGRAHRGRGRGDRGRVSRQRVRDRRMAPAPPGRPHRVRAARLPREPSRRRARGPTAGVRLEPVGRWLQGGGHGARDGAGGRGPKP